jgi:hypothetical protein
MNNMARTRHGHMSNNRMYRGGESMEVDTTQNSLIHVDGPQSDTGHVDYTPGLRNMAPSTS